MTILLRLVRVAFATILSIVAFAALVEFSIVVLNYLFPPDHVRDVELYRQRRPFLGAFVWGVMFRGPSYVFYGTVPLLMIFGVFEWKSIRRWTAYLVVWCAAGLLATLMFSIAATLLSAAAVSYLYWLLAGRSAGKLPNLPTLQSSGRLFRFGNYASYAVLALLAFQLADYAYYGVRLFWVTYVAEPDTGTPPFGAATDRGLTASQKVALVDFPDSASCLKAAQSGTMPDEWKEIDWDRINNKGEAEVCIFRVLATYDDISHATDWFQAQGLRVPERDSSARPHVRRDGMLRVSAYHSIREYGPKFPTRGVVRRAYLSIPHSMAVNATWAQDGTQLLRVTVQFNYL